MKRFSSGVLSLFKQDTFSTLLQIALSVLTARLLGPTQMGFLVIFFAILYYADKLGRLRLEDAGVFLIQKKEYAFSVARRHLFWLMLPQIALTVLILILFKEPILRALLKEGELPPAAYALMLAHIPFVFFLNNTRKLLLTAGNIGGYNKTFWVIPLLQLLMLFGVYSAYGALKFEWVLSISLTAHLASWILSFAFLSRISIETPVKQKPIGELFKVGLKFYGATIPTFLQNRLDIMMVAYFLQPAEAAFYSLATTAAELLWKIPNSVQTLFFPASAALADRDAAQFTINTLRRLSLILIPAAIAGAAFIYPAVKILYGDRYLPVVPPFLCLLPGALLWGFGKVTGSYLQGRGHLRSMGKISLAALLVNAILNFVLIPRYHTLGAAAASAASYSLTALLLIRALLNQANQSFLALIPTREDLAFYIGRIREMILEKKF